MHHSLVVSTIALALMLVITTSVERSDDCGGKGSSSISDDTCNESSTQNEKCLDAAAFQRMVVSSFDDDKSVLSLLRGTVDNVITIKDAKELVGLLPLSDFVDASGYDTSDDNKDRRAYTAPIAYAGLGLKELSTSNEVRYNKVLEIRDKIRLATEASLQLCPGSLHIDFTTISQKTEGGAHRAHADNCIHYFDEGTKMATCDPSRVHPYPKRVAASILYLNNPHEGNFQGGEFYFANRTNLGEVEDAGRVAVETGKMIYFTSGVENLHGALPVERGSNGQDDDNASPRRLAIAMWYVFDQSLEEFVPPFHASMTETKNEGIKSLSGSLMARKVYDPNDPNSPKELFTLPLPLRIDVDSLFQTIGAYLVSQQNSPSEGSWTISQYGENTLHALFKDHSAMLSLSFGVALHEESHAKASVVVERHTDASRAVSLQYMLQESVLLHGLLDYYSKVLIIDLDGEGAKKENFDHEIEKARNTLPARRA